MYDDDELVNMLCMGNFQTDYATKMFRAEQVCNASAPRSIPFPSG